MSSLSPVTLPTVLLAFALSACSPEPADSNTSAEPASTDIPSATTPAAGDGATNDAPAPASTATLGLEGLGDLRIGQPVPARSSWASRGAQVDDECRTISSPDFPGVYAIVTDGKVQRITVGQRSDVKLVEGIGVGAAEKEVRVAFPGFREDPHKYVDAPGKYLTAPNAAGGDPALRFEIGQDGRVSLLHVGMMPALGYVEGCA